MIIKRAILLDQLIKIVEPKYASLCVRCRGTKMLCGKPECPILKQYFTMLRVGARFSGSRLQGGSPPSVFVGRLGYPKVRVAPLVSPSEFVSPIQDLPERWFGLPLDEILEFRLSLVRGVRSLRVDSASKGGRFVETVQEMALSREPVDAEAEFLRPPRGSILLDYRVQPIGPSAPLARLQVDNPRWDRRLERVYYDTDLRAAEAMIELYASGLEVTRIQRALSAGTMGIGRRRSFVPTRWSITAVDSTISEWLLSRIRRMESIDESRVYEVDYLNNRFIILMAPGGWSYELVESWSSGTIWNPISGRTYVISDSEGPRPKREYAEIGGCYYAARLAVAEKLASEGRQATVSVLRWTSPGFLMPLGVWLVRETVREALRRRPKTFSDPVEAVNYALSRIPVRREEILAKSRVIRDILTQRRLEVG